MKEISFSQNWNNKLNCDCFSSIRIWSPEKYKTGSRFNVILNKKLIGVVELVNAKSFSLSGLTEGMALIDTGYGKEQVQGIMRKMYINYINKNGMNAPFGFYIFKYVEKQKNLL
jgi:hypothetical protein